MKKWIIILIFVSILMSCFAKGTTEGELEISLKKAITHKTEKNVHLLFNSLNKWGFQNYFEFSNPYLQENGLIATHIVMDYSLKGDKQAIQTLLNSVNILILDPNNVEYSETLDEEINIIIRKHFVKTIEIIMKLDKKNKKNIVEMLKSPIHDGFDYNELLVLAKKHKIEKRFLKLINNQENNRGCD